MNIQTRGEFEAETGQFFLDFIAFIHYKGKWVETIVNSYGGRINYFHVGFKNIYLSECILKVYKPDTPEKLQTYIDNLEAQIRQDQKEIDCKSISGIGLSDYDYHKAAGYIRGNTQ